jgi:hypothetical protein
MTWKKRLLDLTLAGGALGAAACTGVPGLPGIPVCNANPDPCCSQPSSQACLDSKAEKAACSAAGGTYYIFEGCLAPDGGFLIYVDGGVYQSAQREPDGGTADGGTTDGG